MKCFLIFVIVCSVIAYSKVEFSIFEIWSRSKLVCLFPFQATAPKELIESIKKVVHDCAKKEGASARDIAKVLGKKASLTKAGKCIFACMGESMGIVSLKMKKSFKMYKIINVFH